MNKKTSTEQLLGSALAYQGQGCFVLPIEPVLKKPYVK